jgi:carbonic anhydrase/acetyltransferase-like protein (isoleucine patch superfamily)
MAQSTIKRRLVGFILNICGPAFLFAVRVAQQYSDKRQLLKCNTVGLRVTAGYGLIVDTAGDISISDDVSFSRNSLLSCYKCGSIKIGSNCFFGDNIKIVSDFGSIEIGQDCVIAENVSIRASNHGTKTGTLIRLQPNSVKNIRIGNDCWLGKGVTVLAGSVIADGCVIGANSVVRGNTEANSIYAGVPVRKIKSRSIG